MPRITPKDYKRLIGKVEREIRAGEMVKLGPGKQAHCIRYGREGDTFDEGDEEITMLRHGMYMRHPMMKNNRQVGWRWLCYCVIDYLPEYLYSHLSALSTEDLDEFERRLDRRCTEREDGAVSENRTRHLKGSWVFPKPPINL